MAMSADSGRRVVGPGLTCLVALPCLWLYHLAVYRWYSDGWPGVVPLFSEHCVVSLRRLPCSAFSFNGSYVIFCNVCRYEDSKGSFGKLISFGGSGRILSGVNPFVGLYKAHPRGNHKIHVGKTFEYIHYSRPRKNSGGFPVFVFPCFPQRYIPRKPYIFRNYYI